MTEFIHYIKHPILCCFRTLKDSVQDDCQPIQGGPLLLQAVMAQKPHVFSLQPVKENYQGV